MKLREDKEGFVWIMENVIPHVVSPFKDFNIGLGKRTISELVTTSHEAFSLLVIENYRNVIKEQSEKPPQEKLKRGQRRKDITEKPKYTGNGIGAKKNEGWNIDGLERFVELTELVKKDRGKDKKKGDESTEIWYLNKIKEERKTAISNKSRGNKKPDPHIERRRNLINPIEL